MNRLKLWWRNFLERRRKRFGIVVTDDLPEIIPPRVLVLMGEADAPWQAAMLCPCKCGEVIRLSLVEHDKPRWSARVDDDGLPTLTPSVWRVRGCRSHFILTNGRVRWV